MDWYVIEGLNPIQWQTGLASAGRKNGRIVANRLAKDPELVVFQNAVKESLTSDYPELPDLRDYASGIQLEFRLREVREGWVADGRKVKRNHRDATNLQKALEDALQGILYRNDSVVVDVRTRLETVESGEPLIFIGIGPGRSWDDPRIFRE